MNSTESLRLYRKSLGVPWTWWEHTYRQPYRNGIAPDRSTTYHSGWPNPQGINHSHKMSVTIDVPTDHCQQNLQDYWLGKAKTSWNLVSYCSCLLEELLNNAKRQWMKVQCVELHTLNKKVRLHWKCKATTRTVANILIISGNVVNNHPTTASCGQGTPTRKRVSTMLTDGNTLQVTSTMCKARTVLAWLVVYYWPYTLQCSLREDGRNNGKGKE